MTRHERILIHRRQVLCWSAALASWVTGGCRRPALESNGESVTRRAKVPLRVTLVGDSNDATTITRGWEAVAEHPLEMTTIALDRLQGAQLAEQALDSAARSDVVILPLSLLSEAIQRNAIVPLTGSEFDEADAKIGPLVSAAKNGAARFGGAVYSIPLGAAQPFLLSGNEIGEVESWVAYDRLVEEWEGLAAEPNAPGWAGAMFLWRSAGERSWLFGRDDLEPLVDAESYVRSLEQMVRTCSRYVGKSWTPQQVWEGVASGELRGGIGYPEVRSNARDVAVISELPGTTESSRVLLDTFAPVVALAASCRQSAVAKSFMVWISGGEGSAVVRRQVRGMTDTRVDAPRNGDLAGVTASSYDSRLYARLSSPVTMPTIQLVSAGEYYRVLDAQVTRALREELAPSEALSEVARQWREMLLRSGVEDQLRVWRQAQGMRG